MDNIDVAGTLAFYAKLAELHEQNPYKIKAYAAAAFNLRKVKQPLQSMTQPEVEAIPGVGKSVSKAIVELAGSGRFPELEALERETPPGVLEMLHIKGLGPKKVHIIWKSMGLLSVEALLDACRENRLVAQSGFGYKTQAEIIKAIEFAEAGKGSLHYARAEPDGLKILEALQQIPDSRASATGDFRRCMEVLQSLEFLSSAGVAEVQQALEASLCTDISVEGSLFRARAQCGLPVHVVLESNRLFDIRLLETTGPAHHIFTLGGPPADEAGSEAAMYQSLGFHFVPPEVRDHEQALSLAAKAPFDDLISFEHLQGVLHNHSTWSDGLNNIEEMALACKNAGYTYFAICDHSRSAAYAHGLEPERVLQQFKEVDALNEKLKPFRIFKGIESDILSDGSLDYEDDLLAQFDLVVASVHSNLKMDEAKATARLLRAIEHPATTILGHPTGRLLLLRGGYPIDHQKVIDACAANKVAIELNAHPYRLDIDWRWVYKAMEKGVMISINPDAHEQGGIADMRFGVLAARKGMLKRQYCLNALSLAEFEAYLAEKKAFRRA